MIESDYETFILRFDSDDHNIEFMLTDEDSYDTDILDVRKDLIKEPFSCIWLDEPDKSED